MSRLDDVFEEMSEKEGRSLPPLRSFEPSDVSPVKRLSRNARIVLSAIGAPLVFVLLSPTMFGAASLELYGAMALGIAAIVALALGRASPGESRRIPAPLRRVLPALLIFALLGVLLSLSDHFSSPEFEASGSGCFLHSSLVALAVVVSLVVIWRRTDPFTPRALGAFCGAFSGVLGALSVTLSCPSREGFHLLVGHGLATLLFFLIGLFLGRKLLSP